ncbi:MAG: sulfurtransferase TusA family protein [Deltaproteobacteria bacterium]|nr:sulfurtransferase TusA family protein [Deltaproteobacteria bacterium]
MTAPGAIAEEILDARGRPCPWPIIEAARVLARLPVGARLVLWGTDPALPADLEAFCSSAGHALESVEDTPEGIVGRLRKGGFSR